MGVSKASVFRRSAVLCLMEVMELKKEASLETGGLTTGTKRPLMVHDHLRSWSSAASLLLPCWEELNM